MDYEAVIGLEIHAQLSTESKLFCSCSTKFGNKPNTNICPVCTGQPGVLPVLNKRAIEMALKTAITLHCEPRNRSVFARKNYFYPDLPKDYQVSQYELPLAEKGYLDISVNGEKTKIGITRIHMEEDAGKNIHVGSERITGSDYSLVDYNRTGVPLMEIVSEPDLRTADQARAYVQELQNILSTLGVCDAKMEEGSLRCDANISVRPKGQKEFGVKAELKNMNSTKAIRDGIEVEIERQIKAIKDGERIIQETRHYDEKTGKTVSLRSKEEAHDYRYFPEPDLIPVDITKEMLDQAKEELCHVEFPSDKIERYKIDYKLSEEDATTIINNFAEEFDSTIKGNSDKAKEICNYLIGPVLGFLKENNATLSKTKFKAENLIKVVTLISSGKISNSAAKSIASDLLTTDKDPEEIIKEKGLAQVSDEGAIKKICEEVIKNNEKSVADYKSGKQNAIGFLVGQVMKQSKGKANPGMVNKLLKELLG